MIFWQIAYTKAAVLAGAVGSAAMFYGLRTGYFGRNPKIFVQNDNEHTYDLYLERGLLQDELRVNARSRVDWFIHQQFWYDAPCGCRSYTVKTYRSFKPFDYDVLPYDKAEVLNEQLSLKLEEVVNANKADPFAVQEAKARASLIEIVKNFQ